MSDIASPILAVMDNEAHAFICFCGIMKRLEGNFRPDGQLMSVKFQHLKLLLQYSDPEFYSYLVSREPMTCSSVTAVAPGAQARVCI
ncbi:hypothetical protein PBY51_000049 [Eleginops maclovinus]|uniref:Rab-GAP TBC domain-containing protein n=2 Tax=Eleginops maclovinus TaxID=56733 RepID=A0AAN7XLI5_ELEMC|nr:hypothetical protein PBY51_000049 [Eleginops maclovinus]